MSNNSASGGYLIPGINQPLPMRLTLTQFIQTVIVGISGIQGTLVRPKWQVAPPKQPEIDINWVAFGIEISNPDAYAYVNTNLDGSTTLIRQEELSIACSFYGPEALENIGIFRDGFQITQNLEALYHANMGYKGITQAIKSADLFNERWYNRFEMSLQLVRQVQRTYPVLSFASASGIIHTVLEDQYNLDWKTPEVS